MLVISTYFAYIQHSCTKHDSTVSRYEKYLRTKTGRRSKFMDTSKTFVWKSLESTQIPLNSLLKSNLSSAVMKQHMEWRRLKMVHTSHDVKADIYVYYLQRGVPKLLKRIRSFIKLRTEQFPIYPMEWKSWRIIGPPLFCFTLTPCAKDLKLLILVQTRYSADHL